MSCPVCEPLLREALAHAAAVRAPVGDREVGPYELAAWRRVQVSSLLEIGEAAARLRGCPSA